MNDNITLPRATVQQALEALEAYKNFIDDAYINEGQWHWLNGLDNAQTALKAALAQQAEPVYKDSTPHLHVGDSAFESWFQAQPFATQTGIKQISRDSYAAGMGDPLVVAAPQQQGEPVCPDCKAAVLYECVACSSNNYPQQQADPMAIERWLWIFEDRHGDRYTHKNLFYTADEAAESARICGVKAIKKIDSLKVMQQAEPIGWLDGNDKLAEFMHRDLKA